MVLSFFSLCYRLLKCVSLTPSTKTLSIPLQYRLQHITYQSILMAIRLSRRKVPCATLCNSSSLAFALSWLSRFRCVNRNLIICLRDPASSWCSISIIL
ncbi:hypothetical protein B0H34DRAFT_359655 [Crassisporium funariophilum]|nr:hypothetical protein B0H34DRAFT_359655 [Crassisporium funariophilum]